MIAEQGWKSCSRLVWHKDKNGLHKRSFAETCVSVEAPFLDVRITFFKHFSFKKIKKIKFFQNGETHFATALAIDEHGGLEVELDTGEKQTLRSGEITVRKI